MGNSSSFSSYVYAVPVKDADSKDSTPIYRAATHPDELIESLPDRGVSNAWHLFSHAVDKFPQRPFLGRRFRNNRGELGNYEWITYAEAKNIALQFGTCLLKENMCPVLAFPEEHVEAARQMRLLGIYSKNCVEWFLAEQACNAYGISLVPLYDTMGLDAMKFILNQTRMECCLVSCECVDVLTTVLARGAGATAPLARTNTENVDDSPLRQTSSTVSGFALRTIILVDPPNPKDIRKVYEEHAQAVQKCKKFGIKVLMWNEVCAKGRPTLPLSMVDADGINTLCYTSGTTGDPKGVLLSQRNVFSLVCAGMRGNVGPGGPFYVGPTDIHCSYLPLAHVYERMVSNTVAAVGGGIGLYSGDMTTLLDDIRVLSPTVFVSVPRLFNRINDRVLANLTEKKGATQMLFNQGLNSKLNRHRSDASTSHKLWDAVVFNKIRQMMGGRLRGMICGGAPLDYVIQEKMNCFFCAPLMQGYGLTETFGPCFLSHPADPLPGHIGGPFPSCEFKLVSVPEMGFYITDNPPRGELCMRGPSVTVGYFCNEVEQNASFDENGWFHSGDIACCIGNNGAIKIIDRKKNIFKLSQGEYVTPEKIEGVYQQSLFVGQCFVFGYSEKPSLVAIVVPDAEYCMKWAAKNNYSETKIGALIANPAFKQVVTQDMEETANKMDLKGFEKVKDITFCEEEFSVANGLLTPTVKIKRAEAKKRFEKEIDRMYGKLNL